MDVERCLLPKTLIKEVGRAKFHPTGQNHHLLRSNWSTVSRLSTKASQDPVSPLRSKGGVINKKTPMYGISVQKSLLGKHIVEDRLNNYQPCSCQSVSSSGKT